MTQKDHPVWNKMAVSTLDTLEEAVRGIKRRETIEEWLQFLQSNQTKRGLLLHAYRSLPIYIQNT
jgi:hypothetical protein